LFLRKNKKFYLRFSTIRFSESTLHHQEEKVMALEKLKDIKWNRDTVNEIIDVLRSPLMVE